MCCINGGEARDWCNFEVWKVDDVGFQFAVIKIYDSKNVINFK